MPPAKARAAGAKTPRAPKGHKLAAPLAEGTVFTDFTKKQWTSGKPVGSGGFGLLYLASPGDSTAGPSSEYVLKVEPHSNGPLFCELHFYQRVAKPDLISSWLSSHKLKNIGVPKYIASGSHENNSVKYRFMIMERFGSDLQKLFEANNKCFSRKTVINLGLRLLDALEYVHAKDYVHADIKASNLLLGYAKGTTDQVYLVDYGLAFKYLSDGKHKEYKEDPRKAHDGTIEFTSRDAHNGVSPSRRGDLEILGYCLLQWLCKKLPWEDKLNNKDWVRDQKIKHMDNIPGFMKTCFPSGDVPDEIQTFLEYVAGMDYAESPDYDYLRQMFKTALKKQGYANDGKLDFKSKASPTKASPQKKAKKRKNGQLDDLGSPDSSDDVKSPKGRKARAVVSPRGTPKARKVPAGAAAARSSPAVSRVKGAVGPPMSPAKAATKGGVKAKRGKRVAEVASTATQTSPGLKGLKRSRKK